MARKFFKRFLPDHHVIREHRHLRFLGKLLHDPNLLHLNRYSVSGGFAVGIFTAFIPLPLQMLIAALGAIVLRVNLPIAATVVWITNPLTIPPLFYFAYKLGTWILGEPTRQLQFELSFVWLTSELTVIWQPFLLGCFIMGSVLAMAAYGISRLFWRLHVISNWEARKLRRRRT